MIAQNEIQPYFQPYFYDDLRPKGLSDEALAKSEAIGNQSLTNLSAKKHDSLKSCFYDGDGLRVSRTDNLTGLITYYVWDTENPTGYPQVVEEIENNQVVRRYGYGLFLETIDIKNGTEFERFYVVRDGTNSVRMLLDSTGNVSATYDYDAFGNVLSVTNVNTLTSQNSYGFHSEYKDPATNLVYLRARWYEPENGRFLSSDDYRGLKEMPLSLHKYIFAGDDGVNKFDTTGKSFIDVAISISVIGILATMPNVLWASSGEGDESIYLGEQSVSAVIAELEKVNGKYSWANKEWIKEYANENIVHTYLAKTNDKKFYGTGTADYIEGIRVYSDGKLHYRYLENTNIPRSRPSVTKIRTSMNSKMLWDGLKQDAEKYEKNPLFYDEFSCNSNSFVGTLLRHANINTVPSRNAWGWGNDIWGLGSGPVPKP